MTAELAAALAIVVAGLAARPAPPRRRTDQGVEPVGHRGSSGGPGYGDAVISPPPAVRAPAPAHRAPLRPRRTAVVRLGRSRSSPGPAEVARWCTDIARATRSGSTLGAAIRTAPAPAGAATPIAALHLALDRGAGLAVALERAAAVTAGDPHLQLALTVLRACAEHGGPPSEPVDRAAATLRMRAADLADRRTHSAQARLSAVVMTWLPVAMLGLLIATSAPVRRVLVTPPGLALVLLGTALNLAGWRWMRLIIGAPR